MFVTRTKLTICSGVSVSITEISSSCVLSTVKRGIEFQRSTEPVLVFLIQSSAKCACRIRLIRRLQLLDNNCGVRDCSEDPAGRSSMFGCSRSVEPRESLFRWAETVSESAIHARDGISRGVSASCCVRVDRELEDGRCETLPPSDRRALRKATQNPTQSVHAGGGQAETQNTKTLEKSVFDHPGHFVSSVQVAVEGLEPPTRGL